MAETIATSSTPSTNFRVQGRLFEATSKRGIANLLVTVFDAGAATRGAPSDSESLRKSGIRLGSVLTDASGAFSFDYDRSDIIGAGSQKDRLDLFVVVTPPDSESADTPSILFVSAARPNAGRIETFSIGISQQTIDKYSLSATVGAGEDVRSYQVLRAGEKTLAKGVAEVHRPDIQSTLVDRSVLRKKLVEAIGTRVDALGITGEVAGNNEQIQAKVAVVANRAVTAANQRVAERGVQVNLYLTPDDRTRLQGYFDNAVDGVATIPDYELQDILFNSNSSENPGTLLLHNSPFARACSHDTLAEVCAKTHTGIQPGDDSSEGNGDAAPPATPGTITIGDIPQHIARILNGEPSPDVVLTDEFNAQRPDRATVDQAVNAFALQKGPADVPAFYDYHSLQIAFEHVWQILLDESVVDASHAAALKYKQRTGIDLADQFPGWPNLPISGVYESTQQSVPAVVAAQFDITVEEWTDLVASHQQKLREIALAIESACAPVRVGSFLGERLVAPPQCERRRQELREQGERLIDAVRHDDYYTMHKTLRDLHARINSAYEFTVFAADRNVHSVNFGVLNTYRQQWTPINYQAGRLVKTLPLAPKEERKYSLRTERVTKQAYREARKNNSSLKTEETNTSRVEAEIMKKALSKTNFSLSTSGDYDIFISKGESSTSFGVEAQRETSETRKDFREAVLKAAQEYAEERSVQIDTEETATGEYTESGTVVNPNDELAVTYLFYDLQRRYRVSEQLHRVAPVVLVAQEVPAPHEITEAWVLSNDWILNRSLLDDSFRPALDYLADKSVGDDFAIRELRTNLRQQRNLVEVLKVEFAAASREADNKYRALLQRINDRLAEEEDAGGQGFFTDVGAFFGYNDANPEVAKARELAASDEHQYAVARADKLATSLRQEVNALHTLTREYNAALREHLDNETRVDRLLVHIRNNIFYYMQAIWSMEPPDQRFLRLHRVQVPVIELAQVPHPSDPNLMVPDRFYRVTATASEDIFEDFRAPGTTKHVAFMTGNVAPTTSSKPLVEVADLDNMLGFKGNYMIFPLKAHNALTEFMAAPYVDAAFGAMDPDTLSNVNLSDYGAYVCCLHDTLSEADFAALKPKLRKWLEQILASPLRNGEEVVVPTNSLFVEVLPGSHPLLENFKLRHRELDVYKAQAEIRGASLGNLRLAMRLLSSELGDPDIDKRIVIEGATSEIVVPADS